MRRHVFFSLSASFIIFLFFAPCVKAQGTHTAASCNWSDVNAIINGPTHTAVSGDTINIPPGSCTWTSGISVPSGVGITIIGNGTPNSTPTTTGASASCSNTTITDDVPSGALFSMTPTYGNATSRLSCMKLLPFTPNPGFGSPIQVVGTCTASGCPNLRIDNLTGPTSWSGIGISDDTFAIAVNVFGVADHNTMGDVAPSNNGVDFINVSHASWLGTGGYGDKSWASADTFGTAQAFYLENNDIKYGLGTDTDTNVGTGGGGRWVCRFNTFENISTGGGCGDHGTDTTGRARGGRQYEIYDNTGICTNSTLGCPGFGAGRSGTGIYFGNSFTNSGGGFFKNIAVIDIQRRWRTDSPWGTCDGSSPWDADDGTTYYSGIIASVSFGGANYTITDLGLSGWTTNLSVSKGTPYSAHDVTNGGGFEIGSKGSNTLTSYNDCSPSSCAGVIAPVVGNTYNILRATVCIDQIARGAGLLVQGSTPTLVSTGNPGAVAEALDPIYEMEDSLPSGSTYPTITSATQALIANRDYYSEGTNQAAQTSTTSPFNGSTGTGHGTLANRPASCTPSVGYWATDQGSWNQSGSGGQGQLYICTATNTWTLSYTPYTYPHPLTSNTAVTSVNPPQNLTATVQ